MAKYVNQKATFDAIFAACVAADSNMAAGSPVLEAGSEDWLTNQSTELMTPTNWNIACFNNIPMPWRSFILKHIVLSILLIL